MSHRSTLTLILASLATVGCSDGRRTYEDEQCVLVHEGTTRCDPPEEVEPRDLSPWDGESSTCPVITVVAVKGEGTLEVRDRDEFGAIVERPVCCYPVTVTEDGTCAIVGRPFMQGERLVQADVAPGTGWSDVEAPATPGIDWLGMARLEHASIASFARLTLDLLALGAPATLLAEVHQAGLDEVEHARICFALHAAIQPSMEPGPLRMEPFAPQSACEVATTAVREGCLIETLGACLLAEAAARTTNPEVRALLSRIAGDEARHAALSWRIVGWLVQTQGPEVAAAVEHAFAQPIQLSMPAGMASDDELARWTREATFQVIEPARRVLLEAAPAFSSTGP